MRVRIWGKKLYNAMIALLILFLGGQILMKTISYVQEGDMEPIFSEIFKQGGFWISKTVCAATSPVLSYVNDPPEEKSAMEKIIGLTENVLPVQRYYQEEGIFEPDEEMYLLKNPDMTSQAESQSEQGNPDGENQEEAQDSETGDTCLEEESQSISAPNAEEQNAEEPSSIEQTEAAVVSADIPAVDSSIWNPSVIGTAYPLAKLADYDFLVKTFYALSNTTTMDSSELNAEKLLSRDMTRKGENTSPQILIYHTHSQEEFADYTDGDVSRQIIGTGEYLAQILREQYGYQVIHDTTPYDMMGGTLDRNKAYTYAEEGVTEILRQNPSVELVIDLHRDGVDESVHLVTEINGKPTAKIMFVNGISRTTQQGNIDYLYNPYIEDNLALSFQLQLKAAAYYPDYTRRIMIKSYRYNLHVCPKSLLVEVGAQTNTSDEAKNAMEPLAVMLYKVLEGQE